MTAFGELNAADLPFLIKIIRLHGCEAQVHPKRHVPRFEVTQLAVAARPTGGHGDGHVVRLVAECGVLELDETLTAPGALDLYVAVLERTGLRRMVVHRAGRDTMKLDPSNGSRRHEYNFGHMATPKPATPARKRNAIDAASRSGSVGTPAFYAEHR